MKFKIQAIGVEYVEQNSFAQRETETSGLVTLSFPFS